MIIDLIRHGQTTLGNALIGRRSDPPSTEAGADHVVRSIERLAPLTLMSSPMRRCSQPAAIASDRLRVALETDDRLAEYDFGDWDGLDAFTLRSRHGPAVDAFYADPDANPPPDGERWADFAARLVEVVRALNVRQPKEPAVIVTHAGVMRGLLVTVCGFPHEATWGLRLDYGARLRLHVGRDGRDQLWGQVIALEPQCEV